MKKHWLKVLAAFVALVAVGAIFVVIRTPNVDEPMRVAYANESPRQYGDVFFPPEGKREGNLPLVVFIHGGGWLQASTNTSTEHMARDLANEGVIVWNIEYRGADAKAKDQDGLGGWPMTFEDVAAAVDFVPKLADRIPLDIDLGRVSVAGVSAGGNLASWVCSRPALPDDSPGANPVFTVSDCTGIAGVYDLNLAFNQHDKFVRTLLGGSPQEVPQRYQHSSPAENVTPRSRLVILHGRNDRTVPVDEAEVYSRKARAKGQFVKLIELDNATHGSWGKVRGPQWKRAKQEILAQLFIQPFASQVPPQLAPDKKVNEPGTSEPGSTEPSAAPGSTEADALGQQPTRF